MNKLLAMGRQINSDRTTRLPSPVVIQGKCVILKPFKADEHASSLFENLRKTPDLTDYLAEPLTTLENFREQCRQKEKDKNHFYFAITAADVPLECLGIISLFGFDLKWQGV